MLTFDNNTTAAEQLLLWNLVRLRHSFPSSGRNYTAGYGRLLTDMRVCNVFTSVEELKNRRATLMNKYRRLRGKCFMSTETIALAGGISVLGQKYPPHTQQARGYIGPRTEVPTPYPCGRGVHPS